jgi:hypothetical protein
VTVSRPHAPNPLPEVVDLGRWVIDQALGDGRHSGVALDLEEGCGGTLTVPLGGGARERYIRAHELGHIAWTPRRPPPAHLPEITIQHAEDARIARRLARVGIRAEVRLLSDRELGEVAGGLADGSVARIDAGSSLLALRGTPDGDELARAIAKVDRRLPRLVDRVWAATIGHEPKPPFAAAVEAADRLLLLFGGQGGSGASLPARLGLRTGLPVGVPCTTGAAPPPGRYDAGEPLWGDLEIVDFPRPLRLRGWAGGCASRAAELGTRLGDPARFYRDGRGWRSRRSSRRVGGAVLIDCSGSMGLSAEVLEDLVAANPAAVIATYSGSSDGVTGWLHIVARNGTRVLPEHVRPAGGCNICDGPALEWLARCPNPRIWVSDGLVTGRGEARSATHEADAAAITRRHGIRRVETADALLGEWRRAPD